MNKTKAQITILMVLLAALFGCKGAHVATAAAVTAVAVTRVAVAVADAEAAANRAREAEARRQEAEARYAQPSCVEIAPAAGSEGDLAGRRTYSCEGQVVVIEPRPAQ